MQNYYYKQADGSAAGPLDLGAIGAAVDSGRLPNDTMVSIRTQGPWLSFWAVKEHGVKVFDKPRSRAAKQIRSSSEGRTTLSDWMAVVGWVMIVIGMLSGMVIVMTVDVFYGIAVVLSCGSTGLIFLGFGEVLVRLKEISDDLRRK